MRNYRLSALVVPMVLLPWVGTDVLAVETTVETMLERLTDLERLAWLPDPGETCKQFSSYDPRSKYDAAKDEYVNWGANGDSGHFLREEPTGKVLAEMEGPGCIVRIWSANPAGTLKLFFDGETEPRFVADFRKLIAAEVPPVVAPIVGTRARGANCFLPFPYAKSCKVIVEKPGRMYYHVNYRTFPKDTRVRTFAWPLRAYEREALTRATTKLSLCGPLPQTEGLRSSRIAVRKVIQPGQTIVLARISGQREIVGISMARLTSESTQEERELLRYLTLKAYWDGEEDPSICTPLGDFFGTAPGYNVYRSYPLGMTDDGVMYSRWRMPFQRRASVMLRNDGDRAVAVQSEIWHVAHKIPAERMAYFHAKWRREYPNQVFDWPLLECRGRGRFAGVSLTIWNPVRGWWGEGDEKVYVDGEKFPSTFGTGSEDYFGYAWCCPDLFTHAFHNQPLCEGPRNGNYTSVNRWHLTDDIPFQESYRMTIENYGRNKDYACTTYWYAAHPQTDFFEPLPVEVRGLQRRWTPHKIAGAIECEGLKHLKVETKQGRLQTQDMGGYAGGKWSNDLQLWFVSRARGEWFEVAVPSGEAGKRQLTAYFTKARDYGIGQCSWNGSKVGRPFDAYDPEVVASGPVKLGPVTVKKGQNVLRVEMIGKNEKSSSYLFGLDCLILKPGG